MRQAVLQTVPKAVMRPAMCAAREIRTATSTAKGDYLARLRRIEGQARGLQRMVDEDKYCIDILTQVSAMTKGLQAVAMGLLEDHIGHCVVKAAVAGGPEADAKIKEANEAIARLVRS